MSKKNQFPTPLNWQSADPRTGFLPLNAPGVSYGTIPSGVVNGAMASTNTIFSQILDISRMDNVGAEITWSGTPTGTLSVLVSCSGINFYAAPGVTLTSPTGSASGYAFNFNQLPYRYILFQYTNASGSGTLNIYLQLKDLN